MAVRQGLGFYWCVSWPKALNPLSARNSRHTNIFPLVHSVSRGHLFFGWFCRFFATAGISCHQSLCLRQGLTIIAYVCAPYHIPHPATHPLVHTSTYIRIYRIYIYIIHEANLWGFFVSRVHVRTWTYHTCRNKILLCVFFLFFYPRVHVYPIIPTGETGAGGGSGGTSGAPPTSLAWGASTTVCPSKIRLLHGGHSLVSVVRYSECVVVDVVTNTCRRLGCGDVYIS